jgi:hypothetical protein
LWRLVPLLGAGLAGLLLERAVVVEALLLSDAEYGHGAIEPAERFWTLVLWNPWFLTGGIAFALASVAARWNAPSRPVDHRLRARDTGRHAAASSSQTMIN